MQKFVHLRLHTEFSVTDGILKIKDVVNYAKSDEMLALALTDLHNIFALVKFYKSCRENGIKPIIGAEVNISSSDAADGSDDDFQYKVIILAKNLAGYKELCQLITRSYVENKILDTPCIREEWLFSQVNHNLIVLSGASRGDIGILVLRGNVEEAKEKAIKWSQSFPDSYYLELQRVTNNDEKILGVFVDFAHKLNLPVVATHPIQFLKEKDYLAHEVRVCVAQGNQLDDQSRKSQFSQTQYFMSQAEMIERFNDIPSSITNSVEIAKRCNVEIVLGKYFLPDFATTDNTSLDEYLSILANDGLAKRLLHLFPDEKERNEKQDSYAKRLEFEIEVIMQMGFAGYFLIVADFINWAKANAIAVGPGRGSGAGSLVAYSLGITDLDPMRYGLLFERFLNPERVSMPDFDIDFCQDKRELVIDYVKNKYGIEAVSQIATFGTMSSKAVIKDVGRTLGLPYGLCDSLTKLILNTPAKSYGLLEAYAKFPDLKEKIDNGDEDVARLWELSLQLEDLTRSVGKHAAGVLIAPGKLTDFCPLYLADGMQTSQLDKDDVDAVGLVKFDFLGLRNLTIIDEALLNIKQHHNIDLKLDDNNFNDEATYKLLQSGNGCAIFQLESKGIQRVLLKLEPDRFEDIIALLALYRPGPLGSGMVDDFVKRKKGEAEVNYFHSDLQPYLESTYGVIVYQEQVMQISQIIGGYTLGEADLLRRAMGKKKPEEMARHKETFISGAIKKGYKHELAENLFDLMAKFAEYGFNKSHSAAYAVISYHTAYLKAHYLTCFMSATLSSELDNTDKLYEFYQDCLDNDVVMLPPDINRSAYRFTPVDEKTIRYALGAIKGVGLNVVSLIIEERERNGHFKDFVDFCGRVDKKAINKKALESLVKAGAFDSLNANRAQLLGNISLVVNHLEVVKQNANQGSLFDLPANEQMEQSDIDQLGISLDEYNPWNLKEQLTMEKQAMGFYFSASLFDEYREIVSKMDFTPLNKYHLDNEDMQEVINSGRSRGGKKVVACGMINYIGYRPLKNGGKMAFIKIEDHSGEVEIVLFNNEYESYKQLLKIDEIVIVIGELSYDSFRQGIKIVGKEIKRFDDFLAVEVHGVHLRLAAEKTVDINFAEEFIANIVPMLSDNGAKLSVSYDNKQAQCRIKFPENYKFLPTFANLQQISNLLGKNGWGIN